jgi:hypothetical protein
MSTPRYGLSTVPTNTTNPSVPVNDSLRLVDVLIDTVVEDMSLTAPPTTTDPDIGKVWIPAATATGAWATHEGELAICIGADQWEFVTAPEGKKVRNLDDGADYIFESGAWVAYAPGPAPATGVTINTYATAHTMDPATDAGLAVYNRCADDVTFNTSQSYTAGEVYNIRATAALTLIGTGVTLTAPDGGTLAMSAAMSVTVIMTSSTAGDVIGQTVPV